MNEAVAARAPGEAQADMAEGEAKTARGIPLVVYLVLLGLAVAVPALGFSGYLLSRFAETERAAAARGTQDAAMTLRDAVEREISSMTTTLRVLATSAFLDSGNLGAFHGRASAALQGTDTYILLAGPDLQQLLNTRVPFGEALGKVGDEASVAEPLKTGEVYVSDTFRGSLAKNWVINVAVPVRLGAAPGRPAALIMTRSAESFKAILDEQKLPAGWATMLVDRQGKVIVASDGAPAGEMASPALLAGFGTGLAQPTTVAIDGSRVVVASRPSPDTGWRSVVWVPASVVEAPMRSSLSLLILVGFLLLGLTALLAFWLARRVSHPILGLADDARALGHGEPVELRDSSIREANELSATLVEAAHERRRSEEQVRFLMRELSHRAKNQLAVVIAMARRTGGASDNIADFQATFSERLLGLARSTDLLVAQNWRGVSIEELLAAHLAPFETADSARISLSGPAIQIGPDAAQNIGLAIHELATNASKYGALSVAEGTVTIVWSVSQEAAPRFTIAWTEKGGPPVVAPTRTGFGSVVIQRTVAQSLNAEVLHEYRPGGVVWSLTLPLTAIKAADDDLP